MSNKIKLSADSKLQVLFSAIDENDSPSVQTLSISQCLNCKYFKKAQFFSLDGEVVSVQDLIDYERESQQDSLGFYRNALSR